MFFWGVNFYVLNQYSVKVKLQMIREKSTFYINYWILVKLCLYGLFIAIAKSNLWRDY